MNAFIFMVSILVISALFFNILFSQESKEELAKVAQNPIANLQAGAY
ncbi:MAG TPA: hypothetical protein VLM39_07505 [Ignavibacteriaceae bacterium]|nr:hypothetical protein [Ignavibacteriaceae bacterium]